MVALNPVVTEYQNNKVYQSSRRLGRDGIGKWVPGVGLVRREWKGVVQTIITVPNRQYSKYTPNRRRI